MHLNGTSSENCWPILAGVGSSAGSSRGNRAGLGRAWPGLGHNRIVIVIIVYEKSHSFLVLRWDAAMAGNPHRTNKLEFVQKFVIEIRKFPAGPITLCLILRFGSLKRKFEIAKKTCRDMLFIS